MRLLQISDTHFGTEQPAVMDALADLVAEQQPELLLLCGDITQRATAAQFAAARAFVDRLAVPELRVLPGNHDIPLLNLAQRWARPYQQYTRAFGPPADAVFETPELLLLTLNSTRWYRHKHGELSDAQIMATATRLSRARPGQLRSVALHHPLMGPSDYDQRHNLLRDHRRALDAWAEAGLDVLLAGHVHLPALMPLTAGTPPRLLWALQAGTAVSRRLRGDVPNSVNLLRVGSGRRAVAERWDHATGLRRFVRVQVQVLTPDPLDLNLY